MTKVWKNRLWAVAIPLSGLVAGAVAGLETLHAPDIVTIFAVYSSLLGTSWFTHQVLSPWGKVAQQRKRKLKEAARVQEEQVQKDISSCSSITRELQSQMRRVPDREKTQARECVALCEKILHAVTSDANKRKAAAVFLNDYLRPAEQTLSIYLRLSERRLSVASEALKNAEEKVLPGLAQRLQMFYNNIHLGDITHLATAEAVLEVNKSQLTAEAQVELGLDR